MSKNKGITLVALVITIIVLLILAGITITGIIGDNGILTRATVAKENTRGASVEEARDLWKQNKKIDKSTGEWTSQSLAELIYDLVEKKLLTEEEMDIILGNEEKNIEAQYAITIGNRTINFLNKINFTISLYDFDRNFIEEFQCSAMEDMTWIEYIFYVEQDSRSFVII